MRTKLYVVVDIGCIECSKDTSLVGVFTNREQAESLATGDYFAEGGQGSVQMFEGEIELPPDEDDEAYYRAMEMKEKRETYGDD